MGIDRAYLDNGDYISSDLSKFGHVHSEMLELILFGLFEHEPRTFSDSVDAAQVGGRIQSWVGSPRKGHIGERHGRLGAVGGGQG